MGFNTTKQIGWYHLKEDTAFVDRGYECAAWYERILVPSGDYPIIVHDYREVERGGKKQVDCHIGMAYWSMDGTVVDDYFGALFCGNPVGTYDSKKNAGKKSCYHASTYTFMLAQSIGEGDERYELLPQYAVDEERYISEFDGKEKSLWHIIVKETEVRT